jgi:small GTP-binding protein
MKGRVALIGDSQVGKTSLVQRFLRGQPPPTQKPTIGAVFHTHELTVNGELVSLEIWDTAGQEKYRALGPIYYRNSRAAIAVFDLTRRETMTGLSTWIAAFREHGDDPFVVVAANKSDLDDEIKVDMEEVVAWAKGVDAECVSTSAETGSGVENLFEIVAKHILDSGIQGGGTGPAEAGQKSEGCC